VILGAALLVLVALALFVGGIVTGATALYWSCVAVSAVAAVLLVLARRQVARPSAGAARVPEPRPAESSAPRPPVPPPARRTVREPPPPADTTTTPPDDAVPVRADGAPPATSVTDGTAARPPRGSTVDGEDEDPPVEEVEVTDLLLVMDLHDEVVVVDEHPRYHLAGCPWLRGRTAIPLPLDEARTDGFTPCGRCAPDRHLAAAERERRAGRGAS
jgi:hypothetical protein